MSATVTTTRRAVFVRFRDTCRWFSAGHDLLAPRRDKRLICWGFEGTMSVTISFRRRALRLLQTQGLLTVSMVVPTRTLLVFAVVLALFLHARHLATSLRAVPMASVAAATDRPELGTRWVGALAHEQDLLGMSGHACPKRDWTTTAGSCEAKPHLQASPAGGRLQTRPKTSAFTKTHSNRK